MRREVQLTIAALAATMAATLLTVSDIVRVLAIRAQGHHWSGIAVECLFLVIVLYLVYGACVYQLARLGYLRRLAAHVPASEKELERVYRETDAPLLTVLIPSYMEETRVAQRALLCAALQEYPRRRIVLLIDNPPAPENEHDRRCLKAARALPRQVAALLEEPARLCSEALDNFLHRQAIATIDAEAESLMLAQLHEDVADWFERQANSYDTADHADELFVQLAFHDPARDCRAAAERFRVLGCGDSSAAMPDASTAELALRRLLIRFQTEIVSFERKRYENLSHASNKAMNLNSYIGLLGGRFQEARHGDALRLEAAPSGSADLSVPNSEFLLVVDADSVLTSDYALRLIHLMRSSGNERVAVAQTPYRTFPGAPGVVERTAGATTDMQYIIHQGFTQYGATYWVGANAVIRTAALVDIATSDRERGHVIRRFIQDRTVIEDTESTVDLLGRGWRLHNYPEPLAYSETPPDFGSLLIQRRRWANGGLIIFPKLLRHFGRKPPWRGAVMQAMMMTHYLTSLAAVNVGLLIVLSFSMEDSVRSAWLPLTAIPYYALYAWDLGLIGYRVADVVRVYALNLVLIPVNLVGVLTSIQQAITGTKAAFGRTPKVPGRTRVPGVYLISIYTLLGYWFLGILWDIIARRPVHALLTLANVGLLTYGIAGFIGLRNSLEDLLVAAGGCIRPAPSVKNRPGDSGARIFPIP